MPSSCRSSYRHLDVHHEFIMMLIMTRIVARRALTPTRCAIKALREGLREAVWEGFQEAIRKNDSKVLVYIYVYIYRYYVYITDGERALLL